MISIRITTGRSQVSVACFTEDPDFCVDARPIVYVNADSIPAAFEAAIARFAEMQSEAVEELRRWRLVNLQPARSEGEAS